MVRLSDFGICHVIDCRARPSSLVFKMRQRGYSPGCLRASVLILLVTFLPTGILAQFPGFNQYNNQPYPPPYQPQLGQMNPAIGVGHRDYGDECVPKNMYNSDDCAVGRGLYCAHFRCACLTPGTIYRNGKCRAKVNRPCEAGDGTLVECVINAFCNKVTNLCQCRRDYWSNDEGTACNHGSPTVPLNFVPHLLALTFLTFVISVLR